MNIFALEKYFPGVVLGLKRPSPPAPSPPSNFAYWYYVRDKFSLW